MLFQEKALSTCCLLDFDLLIGVILENCFDGLRDLR